MITSPLVVFVFSFEATSSHGPVRNNILFNAQALKQNSEV